MDVETITLFTFQHFSVMRHRHGKNHLQNFFPEPNIKKETLQS